MDVLGVIMFYCYVIIFIIFSLFINPKHICWNKSNFIGKKKCL